MGKPGRIGLEGLKRGEALVDGPHPDGIDGTDGHTVATAQGALPRHDGLAVSHREGSGGADPDAQAAANTFPGVDDGGDGSIDFHYLFLLMDRLIRTSFLSIISIILRDY
jgi:hypothetical protein